MSQNDKCMRSRAHEMLSTTYSCCSSISMSCSLNSADTSCLMLYSCSNISTFSRAISFLLAATSLSRAYRDRYVHKGRGWCSMLVGESTILQSTK